MDKYIERSFKTREQLEVSYGKEKEKALRYRNYLQGMYERTVRIIACNDDSGWVANGGGYLRSSGTIPVYKREGTYRRPSVEAGLRFFVTSNSAVLAEKDITPKNIGFCLYDLESMRRLDSKEMDITYAFNPEYYIDFIAARNEQKRIWHGGFVNKDQKIIDASLRKVEAGIGFKQPPAARQM